MGVYIVTYDLNREAIRPKIVDEVRKTSWARLSESSYAIETAETPQQIHNRFQRLLDDNDNFFVVTLTRPYYGQGSQEVHNWLSSNLLLKAA